jgi:hypothetical protein
LEFYEGDAENCTEQLHYLYCLPVIIKATKSRKLRLAGRETYTEKKNVYRVSHGKPEETNGTARSRWKDNPKMDLMFC